MADETPVTPIATPAAPAPQPDEGLLHELATSAGLDPEAIVATAKAIRQHPWQVAKEVGSAQAGEFVDAGHHLRDTALSALNGVASAITNPEAKATAIARLKSPGLINKIQGAEEYATAAVPLVGGNYVKAEEQAGRGNIAGSIGTTLGTTLPLVTDTEGAEGIKAHLAETGKTFVDSAKEGLQRAAVATAPEGSAEAGFAKIPGSKKVRGATPKLVELPTRAGDIRDNGWLDEDGKFQPLLEGETHPEGQRRLELGGTNAIRVSAGDDFAIFTPTKNTPEIRHNLIDAIQSHPRFKTVEVDFGNNYQNLPANQAIEWLENGARPGPRIRPAPEPAEDKLAAVPGAKFVGKAPSPAEPVSAPAETAPAAEYHPDLQKIADKFGTHTDPTKIADGPSFIAPDGKFIPLGSTHHDVAIDWAQGSKGSTREAPDNRVAFINDSKAVRVRPTTDKGGTTLHISVPREGISPEQIDALKQGVAKGLGYGNVMMETADNPRDIKTAPYKELATDTDIEPMLKQIGAHPDQQDLLSKELQSPLKEKYTVEITDADGTTHMEPIEAFSSKNAIAVAQKKFPGTRAYSWRIEKMGEREPSTEYSVPTGKLAKMPASAGRPEIHTIRHELGHAMVGQNEGLVTGGMLSSSHPDLGKDARAAVRWPGRENILFNPAGQVRPDKVAPIVKTLMGGIAADEVFNDLPRSANHNFFLGTGGDGSRAYQILQAAGVSHEDAMEYMHKAIDAGKEYLQHPAVSGIINENAGFREAGLSRQFHASPDRLTSMHQEAQRRIANATGQEQPDNRAVSGEGLTGREGNVARGEGGSAQATGTEPAEAKKGIVSKEKIKTPEDDQLSAHEEGGGSTFTPAGENLAGKNLYSVGAYPERTLHVDKLTPEVLAKFKADNADVLSQPDHAVGTWKDPDTGKAVLDVSKTYADRAEAVAAGKDANQKAIYHLGGEGEIQTGGTGEGPAPKLSAKEQKAADKATAAAAQQAAVFKPSTGGTPEAPAAGAAPAASKDIPTVSTRVPTKKVKGEVVEDHTQRDMTSDMDAAKAAPGYLQKMVNRTNTTPGFTPPEGDALAHANAYIRHAADNIKFVLSKMLPEAIKRDEKWYPVGAHERVQAVAAQHGFTPHQIAGVTAVESPMTDWDQNTSLAERTANIWKNQQATKFTPEMQDAADNITSLPANSSFKPLIKKVQGKTLAELPTTEQQAIWLRLYDEGHNPREYQTWNPDGTSNGLALNQDGSPRNVGWSFQSHIQKAIEILKDGSPENISKNLGYGHKVRNFYNNMLSPDDPRYLTMDTHAINVAQLRPMSGKSPAVRDNFGNIKNGEYGLKGTYALHDAAYRLAAKELDIPIPSRLQSPTWTKIRDVFTDDFKTPENQQAIDAIWKEHSDGKITADQARNRIWDYATEWNRENAAGTGALADQGKLFAAGVSGEPASGTGRGTGVGTPREVPEEELGSTDFNFGANVKDVHAENTAKVAEMMKAKQEAMQKGLGKGLKKK